MYPWLSLSFGHVKVNNLKDINMIKDLIFEPRTFYFVYNIDMLYLVQMTIDFSQLYLNFLLSHCVLLKLHGRLLHHVP